MLWKLMNVEVSRASQIATLLIEVCMLDDTYSLIPTDVSEWRRVWFEGEWWFAIPDVIKCRL
jgi:hypothetical protein